MRTLLLAGAGLIALLGGSSSAADLARPGPVYAPPPPLIAVFTWTGCYIGGNAGGILAHSDWSDTFNNNKATLLRLSLRSKFPLASKPLRKAEPKHRPNSKNFPRLSPSWASD